MLEAVVAVNPPLPSRASPPQGGRSTGGERVVSYARLVKGEALPQFNLPPCGGDARQGRGGYASALTSRGMQ
jgi:hypothetical protein